MNKLVLKYKKYNNKNLCVVLYEDGLDEVFTVLTKNLVKLDEDNIAYVDVNNNIFAPYFLYVNGIAEYMDESFSMNFCNYPLYKFDLTMDGQEFNLEDMYI